MAFAIIPTLTEGDNLTEDFTLAVKLLGDQLTAAVTPIRQRRHRNGLVLAVGTTAVLAGSVTGTIQENVGGIGYTADPANGFFTINTAGNYAIMLTIDPATALGATSTINMIISGTTYQLPVVGGTVGNPATFVRYLPVGATIAFSVTNNTAAAVTATILEFEITRVACVAP